MKNYFLLALCLMFINMRTCVAQQQAKHMFIRGIVKDTAGHPVSGERVALINQRGNDQKIVVTDREGKFSFKVRQKKMKVLTIKCYSNYVATPKIKLSDFIDAGSCLVLKFDKKKVVRGCGWICGPVRFTQDLKHMPCNYQTAEMVRFFPMVK